MEWMKEDILDCLFVHARQCPDKIALILPEEDGIPEKTITYAELDSMVRLRAFELKDEPMTGERILLMFRKPSEFICSFLACQFLGAIPIPLPSALGRQQIERLNDIIDDSLPHSILCEPRSGPLLQKQYGGHSGPGKFRITSLSAVAPARTIPLLSRGPRQDISFIQYTSGSTSQPKGVIVTTANLMSNQQMITDAFGCDASSIIFSWLPFHHDMGLIGNILHTLYIGCTCILMSAYTFIQKPEKWLEAISHYKVTHSGGPNFAYDLCIDRISPQRTEQLDLSSWKVAYNGSEPLRAGTLQRFADHFKAAGFSADTFYPCYGLAEATLLVSGKKRQGPPEIVYLKADPARAIVSCGSLAPGMEIVILSAADRKIEEELEQGEICITGANVTQGYWNKEDRGQFPEIDGKRFLRTGDLGFIYKGELFIDGRIKEMLIIRGRNVYPYDIEEMIAAAHIDIEKNGVAVCCSRSDKEEFIIIAEIKRTSTKALNARELLLSIDSRVKGMTGSSPVDILLTVPRAIPRTTSGKLQRIKCFAIYERRGFDLLASKTGLAPRTVVAARDASLPAEVLRNRDITTIQAYILNTVRSRFTDLSGDLIHPGAELSSLGIDSLRGTELINTINKELGINLDAASAFEDNTLSGLIDSIDNILWLKNEDFSGKEITI